MKEYFMPKTPITDDMAVTYADRIRAMSDEELGDWMFRYQVAIVKAALGTFSVEAVALFEEGIPTKPKLDDVMEWLRQPAEVDV